MSSLAEQVAHLTRDPRIRCVGPTRVEVDARGRRPAYVLDAEGIHTVRRGRLELVTTWSALVSVIAAAIRGQVNLLVRNADRGRSFAELDLGRDGPDPGEVRAILLAVARAGGHEFDEEHWLNRTLQLRGGRNDSAAAGAVRSAALPSVWYLDREPELDDDGFLLSARVEIGPAVPPAERARLALRRGEEGLDALRSIGRLGLIQVGRIRRIDD